MIDSKIQSICVVGLGYIGLPTASLFANNGIPVLGVDTNEDAVRAINSGRNHVDEVGLRTLVEAGVASGHLKASGEPAPADAFIIAVPTPFDKEKKPDLTHVFDSVKSILPYLRSGNLVIIESTVPPGTTYQVACLIASGRKDLVSGTGVESLKVLLAHCPERVLPGKILTELVENDRIVGGVTPEASKRAAGLYGLIASGKIYQTDATTAEMVKLSENTYRDVNISLANEFALICERLGIDVWEVINLANNHPRVKILNPGPGVGGHCIAVDPWFIVSAFPEESRLIRAARDRNDAMPTFVVNRAMQLVEHDPHPKIACLGASYKGNVGDPRNSPAIEIYKSLCTRLGSRGQVVISDGHVTNSRVPLEPLESAIAGATLLVLLTDHDEYKELDPGTVGTKVREKIVLDTRGALEREKWQSAGFRIFRLGRGNESRRRE